MQGVVARQQQAGCMGATRVNARGSVRVLRRALLVFLGLVLGFNAYLLNAQNVAGNLMPMPFGVGVAVVQSGSMEPTLHVGDLLVVQQQGEYDLQDVVVYQTQHSLVVHRIVAKNATMFTTQGDANNTADAPIEATSVKGKVVFAAPFAGYVAEWLRSPLGIVLVTAAAVALVELSFRRDKKLAHMNELLEQRKIEDEIRRLKAELNNKQ